MGNRLHTIFFIFKIKLINMKTLTLATLVLISLLFGCKNEIIQDQKATIYLDYSNYDDQFTGGIKMIPISTPKGKFKVWTKRIGKNPKIKNQKNQ